MAAVLAVSDAVPCFHGHAWDRMPLLVGQKFKNVADFEVFLAGDEQYARVRNSKVDVLGVLGLKV
jgi:hypothetical protein